MKEADQTKTESNHERFNVDQGTRNDLNFRSARFGNGKIETGGKEDCVVAFNIGGAAGPDL